VEGVIKAMGLSTKIITSL